jgi:hypothetical protein
MAAVAKQLHLARHPVFDDAEKRYIEVRRFILSPIPCSRALSDSIFAG